MSDNEFDYEYDDESGDEWGNMGDQQEDDEAITVENNYYEADDEKKTKPKEALEKFENVVLMESQLGEDIKWLFHNANNELRGFKALENIVVLSAHLELYDKMIENHQKLLKMLNKVTRNDATDAVNSVLDAVNSLKDEGIRQKMYELTLDVLRVNNERLWFTTSLKLGKIYLDRQDFQNLDNLLNSIKAATGSLEEAKDSDPQKGGLLEIYALEIQLYTATKNKKKLKEIYNKTTSLNSVLSDPRVMGVIKECGGKMYMSEKNWTKAMIEIFEAFKNYQETGNPRAKTVLKHVVLTSILSASEINPFDTREAKVYKDDPEIQNLNNLRTAYENNDFKTIQRIFKTSMDDLMKDPFVKEYLEDLLVNIRMSIILAKIKPYKKVKIDYLAKELQIDQREITILLMDLILDGRICGKIDQVNGYLEILSSDETNMEVRNKALRKWVNSLGSITANISEMVK